ncbi:unnamed protein product, partial [Rotaria sp. Silwood2]
IESVKAFQLLTSSKISSTSTIPYKENDRENDELDLITDNQIKSSEDLANDCDKLEQQDESVIKSGFVQTDAEDVSAKYLLEV